MKKIVIINGHPKPNSFNTALAEAYKQGAIAGGAIIREINIGQLQFNPNLSDGYSEITELEPDLIAAWEKIKWANHLVWVHPVWWGGLPAITKGFIDRLFLPGMAFKYRENSVFWDKLLKGKTARIITTMDQPGWYYWLVFGRPSINQLKKTVLQFCGVKPVKVTAIGIIKTSSVAQREKWLQRVRMLGEKLK
ncbi:NAD(P)H-dependent oxidoreductase [Flavobacterium litorale]|uniref:NAD(P)H-dependent oxidoreductase n=1 Tax=Flavobacterium litorale TaxID=2856519 RepID=A0ABX8V3J0_9FLAO|nr:NAD(P)H-dependent oxidoreductase [Flavobacterium litorale]QYJ67413.1 NAD(P)H-dependent oxidoreductase [Flavobacterium litorale]